MIRKDREKKEYAKEQTWIEKLDPAERDSHAAGQEPAQTSRDLSDSWQEGKPRMPEQEPAHISKDLFSGWKEGKPHMPEQKPAHISRDLFCDWQEGKLKTPEETDFFTHIGACTFCAEQFANWMEEGILDEGELAQGSEPLDIPEFAQGPEPLDIPELASGPEPLDLPEFAQGPGPLDIPEFGLKNRQQAGTALDGKFCSQGGEGALWKEPPRYLKEEILTRTRQLDVKAAVKLKETSRQVQLMVYSLKVGFAVVASIFLLTITADIQNMNPELIGNQQPGQAVELQGNQTSGQEQGMEESQTSGQAQGLPENQKAGQAEGRKDGGDIVSRLRQGSKEITGLLNELSNGLFRVE